MHAERLLRGLRAHDLMRGRSAVRPRAADQAGLKRSAVAQTQQSALQAAWTPLL